MPRDSAPDWGRRHPPPDAPPRVIVIGAGVAGLATAVYARMSGARTHVFEQHVLPGGCCTAWARDGYVFDYCIEWLLGTAPGNDAHRVWRELGALDGKTITDFDAFNTVVDAHGRSVTFYRDPDRLERHLLEVSPADAPLVLAFCRDLRRFADIDLLPPLTPAPLRTVPEWLALCRTVLPALGLFRRTAGTRMSDFCGRFRDPLLRRAFPLIFFQDPEVFPLLPYLFTLASAHRGNAGFPQGGSLGLARSIEERYLSLGGGVSYRSRVDRVLVEGGRAVGVQLRDGTRCHAEHVVAACDGRTTVHRLLGGAYGSPRTDLLYSDLLYRPDVVYPGVVSTFVGVAGEVAPHRPHSVSYLLSEQEAGRLPGATQGSLVVQLRSRYSDGFAPAGRSVLHCTYLTDSGYWKRLRHTGRTAYRVRKREVADFVTDFLQRRYPETVGRVEVVDVASPVTTERYTGNHGGAILGWRAFTEADRPLARLVGRDRMRLPGLRGFSMAGQWVAGGGLIRAACSGRYAAQYLCRELGLRFTAWESPGARPWHPDRLGRLPQLDPWPTRRPAGG